MLALLLVIGCKASSAVPDCAGAGGSCVTLVPGSACPANSAPSGDHACSAAGSTCCMPAAADSCTPAGGTCEAFSAGGNCPPGSAVEASLQCGTAGSVCCTPYTPPDPCTAVGGSCLALTPSSTCPTGTTASSKYACWGVGSQCCIVGSDGNADITFVGPYEAHDVDLKYAGSEIVSVSPNGRYATGRFIDACDSTNECGWYRPFLLDLTQNQTIDMATYSDSSDDECLDLAPLHGEGSAVADDGTASVRVFAAGEDNSPAFFTLGTLPEDGHKGVHCVVNVGDIVIAMVNTAQMPISGDGSTIAITGWIKFADGSEDASVYWTPAAGAIDLGKVHLGNEDRRPFSVFAMSADASIAVGEISDSGHTVSAPYVRDGNAAQKFTLLPLPAGVTSARAEAMNADASMVFGHGIGSGGKEIVWSKTQGTYAVLATVDDPNWTVQLRSVADNGLAVGVSSAESQGAILWDPTSMQIYSLRDWLAAQQLTLPFGYSLLSATGIARDGKTIVGVAGGPDKHSHGFILRLH